MRIFVRIKETGWSNWTNWFSIYNLVTIRCKEGRFRAAYVDNRTDQRTNNFYYLDRYPEREYEIAWFEDDAFIHS